MVLIDIVLIFPLLMIASMYEKLINIPMSFYQCKGAPNVNGGVSLGST